MAKDTKKPDQQKQEQINRMTKKKENFISRSYHKIRPVKHSIEVEHKEYGY